MEKKKATRSTNTIPKKKVWQRSLKRRWQAGEENNDRIQKIARTEREAIGAIAASGNIA